MRITYTLMFHRQIFYIVSLTKVGNDKWKNKRKDKFFNMVVTRGIPPLQRATRKARHPKSQTYNKKRAGNSMSCLPRNLYQTKSTWYLCLIQKQQRGLLRLQRSWSADLLRILSRNRYRERLHRVLPLPDRCRSTLCR